MSIFDCAVSAIPKSREAYNPVASLKLSVSTHINTAPSVPSLALRMTRCEPSQRSWQCGAPAKTPVARLETEGCRE